MSKIARFFTKKSSESVPPHPRPTQKYTLPLCADSLKKIFAGCSDFTLRPVWPGGIRREGVSVCWLEGLVSAEAVSGDVLRPLTDARLFSGGDDRLLLEELLRGAVWSCAVSRCDDTDALVAALLSGSCAVVFDALGAAAAFETRSALSRAVGPPTVEKSVKGG